MPQLEIGEGKVCSWPKESKDKSQKVNHDTEFGGSYASGGVRPVQSAKDICLFAVV